MGGTAAPTGIRPDCEIVASRQSITPPVSALMVSYQTPNWSDAEIAATFRNVFERIIWMTQRLARLLDRPGRTTVTEPASALFEESVARG